MFLVFVLRDDELGPPYDLNHPQFITLHFICVRHEDRKKELALVSNFLLGSKVICTRLCVPILQSRYFVGAAHFRLRSSLCSALGYAV
jgi:hypothetical protein